MFRMLKQNSGWHCLSIKKGAVAPFLMDFMDDLNG